MNDLILILDIFKVFLDGGIGLCLFARDYWVTLYKGLSTTDFGNILIYTAGIIWGIELIPQLIRTHKTKDVKGISLAFFVLCFFAYTCYTVGNILLNNINIVIAHIPSLVLTLWMLILIFKYGRK